jgi:hypothetical protein
MAFPKASRAVYMQQRVVTNMESENKPYGRKDFDPFLPLMLLCSMDRKEENAWSELQETAPVKRVGHQDVVVATTHLVRDDKDIIVKVLGKT